MEKLNINKINVDIVWEMIWRGWDLVRVNYLLCVVMVLAFFGGILLGQIPFIGPLISAFIAALAPLAFLEACSKWEKGEQSDFAEIFKVYDNKSRLNKMMPLLIINFVISSAPPLLMYIPFLSGVSSMLSFLTFPVSILISLAYPIFFFNFQSMNVSRSLALAVEGLTKNFAAFVVSGVLLVGIAFISILALALPFVFVAFPVIIAFNYLWYRVIYEDLVIEVKDEGII